MTQYSKLTPDGERTGNAKTIGHIIDKELEKEPYTDEHQTLRDQVNKLSSLLGRVIDVMPEDQQHAFALSLGYHPISEPIAATKNKR